MGLASAEFGDCDVDAKSRVLRKQGEVAHVSHKAFDLLSLLLARRPSVVDKQAIMDALWPNTYVSDANVSILIAELRAAIGDTPQRCRFIRTVHRVGYAFSAEAHVVLDEPRERPAATALTLLVEGRETPLVEGDNVLGRDKSCEIRLNSPTVSRRHSRITVKGSSAVISDLGSKNGTLVCGVRLKKAARLCSGDEIQIGEVHMEFRAPESDRTTRTYTPTRRRSGARRAGGHEPAKSGPASSES